MDGLAFGWRDGVLLLAALAAIYLVVLLLRLTQVGRARRAQPPMAGAPRAAQEKSAADFPPRDEDDDAVPFEHRLAAALPAVPHIAAAAPEPGDAPTMDAPAAPPAPSFEWSAAENLARAAWAEAAQPAPAPETLPDITEPPPGGGFGQHLAEHLARSDMELEVQRMRDEMERMRAELTELRVARRVSPQYAEAMELSQRGMSAQDVADRLGISLAEAELVRALSRGDKNFDEGGKHGEDRYAADDAFGEFGGRRVGGR